MQINQNLQNDGQRNTEQRLPSLPSNDNEYWKDAEVHGNLVPKKISSDEGHRFEYTSAVTARCTHCDWGFQLDPGDKILDGHLYDKLGKLII